MKTILALAFTLSLAGTLLAADPAPTAPKDPKKPQPATQPAKPVNKFCAVEQEHDADPKVTHTYNGKVYAFCCNDCIDTFKKNPEKYKNAK